MSDSKNTYLLDCGASISIFKENKLLSEFPIDYNSNCKITGISKGEIYTIGLTNTQLEIGNNSIEHSFQIVNKDFPIPVDGILGIDFLSNNKCVVDYNNWTLTVNINNSEITIPIYDSPDGQGNLLIIPARSEVIRRIEINSEEDYSLIPNQILTTDVYVARTIVSKSDPHVKILNISDEDIPLTNVKVISEKLSDYTILDPDDYISDNRKIVLEKLQKNFPDYAYNDLNKLCSQFLDIFALETDKISYNNFYKQKLRLKDDQPVYVKNYRIPHAHQEEINRKIDNMLNNGTIEPSMSEYNSPILLVPKKSLPGNPNKRWRFCVDYRQINKKLIADKFPLPRIDCILDQLGRARYFSIIDLLNGFYQIELEDDSKDITSFTTDKGTFRFKSIPFGIKIGPNAFQRMMSIAFSGLSPTQGFIYMDDLVVVASSEKQMVKNLTNVFETCRKYNLKLNPDKCEFFKREVTYLGHRCTDKGILPDESKYSIISNYPRPTDADSAKRFIAFCNYYRRFIKRFAHHACYITNLTRKKVKFFWSENCEKAFQYLKQSLIKPPILKYPDFNKPFCITTDASKIACGAVLTQEYDGVDHPISYASRAFTPGERNKSTPLQELTAIHWALTFFRPYVFGSKFLVKSDHRPLVYLFTMKNPSSKLVRMRLDLEEYDFEIEHIKGKDNVVADALSRIDFKDIKQLATANATILKVTTRSETRQMKDVEEEKNRKSQFRDEQAINIKVYEVNNPLEVRKIPRIQFRLKGDPYCIIRNGKQSISRFGLNEFVSNNILNLRDVLLQIERKANEHNFMKLQISLNDDLFKVVCAQYFKEKGNETLKTLSIAITPNITMINNKNEKLELLNKFHADPVFGGHCGTRRLYSKLRLNYFWTNMTKDIATFVRNCLKCQQNKSREKNKEELTITPTPQKAFDIVSVDTIGPLIRSNNGNEYAVTLMCDLTKYLVTIAVPDKQATTIARAIYENFILIYGPMTQLLTDRGSEYVNSILNELSELLNIKRNTSTANHHRTLGTIERSHRTFNEYVRSYINERKTDWDDWLPCFTYCFNTTPSTAINGYCPFQLIFAKNPPTYRFLNSGYIDPVYNIDSYYQEVRYRLQTATKLAQIFLEKSKMKRKSNYDKNIKPQTLEPGDLVLIEKNVRHKLDPLYKGPFKVNSVEEPNVIVTGVNDKNILLHKDKVKKFHAYFYYRFLN